MRPVFVALEGNIGAGKTSILQKLQDMGFKVVFENLEAWSPFLELFYSDQSRWSFALQTVILEDMNRQKRSAESYDLSEVPYVFFERSPASSMIFARLTHASGNLTDFEFDAYFKLYSSLSWQADVSLLVDTPATTCLERIQKRARDGEQSITLDYLKSVELGHRGLSVDAVLDGTLSTEEICQILVDAAHKVKEGMDEEMEKFN